MIFSLRMKVILMMRYSILTARHPDMTETKLYRNADFTVGEEKESYLTPEEVAEAVEYVLNQREGIVIPELVLRPQLHRIRKKK